MRRYIPALLLALTAIAPFPLTGCDLIDKLRGGDDEDAATDAAMTADADPDNLVPPPPPPIDGLDAAPTTTLTTVVPTNAPNNGPTPGPDPKPEPTDAGAAPKDAGAAPKDGGPAPIPTPNFKLDAGFLRLPKNLLDAGLFKRPTKKK